MIWLIRLFAPWYYRRVWNAEYISQMEERRLELYELYPGYDSIVDRVIENAYKEDLK